jgi:hypothetical protein
MQYFPDYIYSPQSSAYQAPADQTSYQPNYPNQSSTDSSNTTYPGYQSQPQSQSYNSGSTPSYDSLRLSVRCNVQPDEMPYGCGAAYTLVNRTARSLYVTFDGGDTQTGGANSPLTIQPGQSIAGNTLLRPGDNNVYNDDDTNGDDLNAAPPFVIEIQDCGSSGCANY